MQLQSDYKYKQPKCHVNEFVTLHIPVQENCIKKTAIDDLRQVHFLCDRSNKLSSCIQRYTVHTNTYNSQTWLSSILLNVEPPVKWKLLIYLI